MDTVETYTVELPALDGRDPLGFLAALGATRLLDEHTSTAPRLSWSEDIAAARITSTLDSCDGIAAALARIVDDIPDGSVLPGVAATFPPAPAGSRDPMRPVRGDYPALAALARAAGGERWLPAITTDHALDPAGRCALTPYMSPVGRQTVRTFFGAPLAAVRRAPHQLLHEALTGWRRYEGVTGEQLDWRAPYSAADSPRGKAGALGVPGATWLATMALPWLPLAGTGKTRQAALWHRMAGRDVMVWPLWSRPAPAAAVPYLWDVPNLRCVRQDGHGVAVPGEVGEAGSDDGAPLEWAPDQAEPMVWSLHAQSIFTVGAAERWKPRPDYRGAGLLAPVHAGIADERRPAPRLASR